jgi:hypothetical protein
MRQCQPQSWLIVAGLGLLLRLGLVGGAGGSLSGLGDFGSVQAEGAACASTRSRGYATLTGASGLLPADGSVVGVARCSL